MTPNLRSSNDPLRGEYLRSLTRAAKTMTRQFFGVGWSRILLQDKSTEVSRARRWACWWLKSQGLTLREVARCVKRDHKAVDRMVAKASGEDRDGRMDARQIAEIANRELGCKI
jgi:hypothetical protein